MVVVWVIVTGAALALDVIVIVVGGMTLVSVTVIVIVEGLYWPEDPGRAVCPGAQAWVMVTVDTGQ